MPPSSKREIRKCRYCHGDFLAYNKFQEVCKNEECQHTRKLINWKNHRKKQHENGWYKNYKRGWYHKHTNDSEFHKKRNEYGRMLYRKHIIENRRRVGVYNKERRRRALLLIGGDNIKCSSCGCDMVEFVELNHIAGGGYTERQSGMSNHQLYGRILSGAADRSGFDLRCKLCNWFYSFTLKHPKVAERYRIEWLRNG
jgi:hypothetical protein